MSGEGRRYYNPDHLDDMFDEDANSENTGNWPDEDDMDLIDDNVVPSLIGDFDDFDDDNEESGEWDDDDDFEDE